MKKKIVAAAVACVFMLGNFGGFANAQSFFVDTHREQTKGRQVEEKFIEPVKAIAEKDDAFEVEFFKKPEAQEAEPALPTFALEIIKFKGNTAISNEKLQEFASDILDTDVNIVDIKNFVVAVSRFYHQEGFLTSYSSLPIQLIHKGTITIYIHESPVKNLLISGSKWAQPWYLEKILFNRKGLRAGDVFDAKPLQSVLKEINNDLDYMRAQIRLKREEDDSTSLSIDISDRFPITLRMSLDDYGRDNTGREQFTAIAGLQNVTGFGDKIYVGGLVSDRSWGALAGYSLPVSRLGTRLTYDFSYTEASIGGSAAILGIEGRSTIHSAGISQPLLRSANTDIIAKAGLDFIGTNSQSQLFSITLSDYDLRVARVNISALNDGQSGRWIFNGGIGAGLDAFGASKHITGGYDEEFIKLNIFAARVQRFPVLEAIGVFRLSAQYSPDKLYPIEQMQLGGPYSLRGYQPGEIIGDNGVSGTIEFRFPVPGLKLLSQRKLFSNLHELIKIAPFYDFGYVSSNMDGFTYPNDFLQSAGVSIYAYPFNYLTVNLGVGFPLGRKAYDEKDSRFYFSISTDFDRLMTPVKH